MANPPDRDEVVLGEQVRRDAEVFIDATVRAFREHFAKEYFRMRGYAVEVDASGMVLQVELACMFEGPERGVVFRTRPQFAPSAFESGVRIPA